MIGISRTMNMVLHGRHITSREAQDYGISNKIVSSGTGVCIFLKLHRIRVTYNCLKIDK